MVFNATVIIRNNMGMIIIIFTSIIVFCRWRYNSFWVGGNFNKEMQSTTFIFRNDSLRKIKKLQ